MRRGLGMRAALGARRVGPPDDAGARLDAVARSAERLAALLDAGISPLAAWAHLVDGAGPAGAEAAAVAERVHRAARSPLEVPEALDAAAASAPDDERRGWAALAAAWEVAGETGSPLAPTLRRGAAALRDRADASRELETALAGPAASGRIVLVLPLVGVLFGLALGADTLGVLLLSPPGWVCLVLGSALLLAGRRWTARLLARARAAPPEPGLPLDLAVVAVGGGASLPRARALVVRVLEQRGLPHELHELDASLDFAAAAGIPVRALLASEADALRRSARSAAQRRAAELGVKLMLPLGACVLPSFLLLGVVPVMLGMIRATAGLV